jgi:hypothetical protein
LIKDFFDRCHYQSFIKNFVKVFFDKEDEMMFTKQKHMIIKRRERENQEDD